MFFIQPVANAFSLVSGQCFSRELCDSDQIIDLPEHILQACGGEAVVLYFLPGKQGGEELQCIAQTLECDAKAVAAGVICFAYFCGEFGDAPGTFAKAAAGKGFELRPGAVG